MICVVMSPHQLRCLVALVRLQRADIVEAHSQATLAGDPGAARELARMIANIDTLLASFTAGLEEHARGAGAEVQAAVDATTLREPGRN